MLLSFAVTLTRHDIPPDALSRIKWLLDSPGLQYRQRKVKVRVHCTLVQAMKAKRGVNV